MISRTRFAPSPTGSLHVGGARTALYCWMFARHTGGKFVLRIEDTDRARSTDESTRGILTDIRWLGLDWDEGPGEEDVDGIGPFFQSERLETYNGFFEQLLEKDLAYEAWESRDELSAMRAASPNPREFHYSRRAYTEDEVAAFKADGRAPVLRLDVPRIARTVNDSILGAVTLSENDVDDFVIRKADGFPTYHFAVVIDDHLMKITQVLRGQEHLMNTAKHMAIQTALGIASPSYGHFPLIMNMGGGKMSKRDKAKVARAAARDAAKARGVKDYDWLAEETGLDAGDVALFMKKKQDGVAMAKTIAVALDVELPPIEVMDFRKAGVVPEALLNYLGLLGWNPGGDSEIVPLDEMAKRFELKNVSKSAAKFDIDKLLAFNGEYLRSLPRDVLLAHMQSWFAVRPSHLQDVSADRLNVLLDLFLARARTFVELEQAVAFVFEAPTTYVQKSVTKFLHKGGGHALLSDLSAVMDTATTWDAQGIQAALEGFASENELGLGKIAQPLRLALTGTAASPSIHETVALFSKDEVQARIARCVEATAP